MFACQPQLVFYYLPLHQFSLLVSSTEKNMLLNRCPTQLMKGYFVCHETKWRSLPTTDLLRMLNGANLSQLWLI